MQGLQDTRVIIVGAGMSGLLAAIRLKQRGIDDLVILEKGDGVGGTWRDNAYPGCACDVPSHLYSYSRSEEHTSELQSLMRISYAVFCLKKKTHQNTYNTR